MRDIEGYILKNPFGIGVPNLIPTYKAAVKNVEKYDSEKMEEKDGVGNNLISTLSMEGVKKSWGDKVGESEFEHAGSQIGDDFDGKKVVRKKSEC